MIQDQQIIDVWMQHPNLHFINHPMFASLRHWMGMDHVSEDIPVAFTLAAMACYVPGGGRKVRSSRTKRSLP